MAPFVELVKFMVGFEGLYGYGFSAFLLTTIFFLCDLKFLVVQDSDFVGSLIFFSFSG